MRSSMTHAAHRRLAQYGEPMAVPGYQTFMQPLLEELADGRAHKMANVADAVADRLGLTAEDRAEQLPSGKQRTHANRIG